MVHPGKTYRMGTSTNIEWTESTWNPVRGCSVVSPGCEHCYAMGVAARFSDVGQPYEGLAKFSDKRRLPQWTGKVQLVPEHLDDPLRWTKPRRVFVNSMSDLFHEGLSNATIAAVFGVMAASPRHTFQILTKRARRMREWFEWVDSKGFAHDACLNAAMARVKGTALAKVVRCQPSTMAVPALVWPLPNVWLGVSAEDQLRADERIPELLRTPASVRFVSYEPALGLVKLREPWLHGSFLECPDETQDEETDPCRGCPGIPNDGSTGGDFCGAKLSPHLDWIIVGGESGPRARPFDVAWARSIIEQCRDTDVAVFVKQLGAHVRTNGIQLPGTWWPKQTPLVEDGLGLVDDHLGAFRKRLDDKKGGKMDEWPRDLRVRQYPTRSAVARRIAV